MKQGELQAALGVGSRRRKSIAFSRARALKSGARKAAVDLRKSAW